MISGDLLADEIAYLEGGVERGVYDHNEQYVGTEQKQRCDACGHLEVLHNRHCCQFCMIPGCLCEWGKMPFEPEILLDVVGRGIVFAKNIWQTDGSIHWLLEFVCDKGVAQAFVTFTRKELKNTDSEEKLDKLVFTKLNDVFAQVASYCSNNDWLLGQQ